MGSCDPVSTMDLLLSWMRYDKPAAVYAIVSVPWVMTNPS